MTFDKPKQKVIGAIVKASNCFGKIWIQHDHATGSQTWRGWRSLRVWDHDDTGKDEG